MLRFFSSGKAKSGQLYEMKKPIAQQLLKAKTGPYMRWKRSTCCPRYNFRSPTCNCYPTAFDVGLNVASQVRPGVFSGDQLSSFVDPEVAGQWVIMVPTNFPLWWLLEHWAGPGVEAIHRCLLPSHLSGFVLWSSSPPETGLKKMQSGKLTRFSKYHFQCNARAHAQAPTY